MKLDISYAFDQSLPGRSKDNKTTIGIVLASGGRLSSNSTTQVSSHASDMLKIEFFGGVGGPVYLYRYNDFGVQPTHERTIERGRSVSIQLPSFGASPLEYSLKVDLHEFQFTVHSSHSDALQSGSQGVGRQEQPTPLPTDSAGAQIAANTYLLTQSNTQTISTLSQGISELGRHVVTLGERLATIDERVKQGLHDIYGVVRALCEQLHRIQAPPPAPPPPPERSLTRQIEPLRALFAAIQTKGSALGYQGRLDHLVRAELAQHLDSLYHELVIRLPQEHMSELEKLRHLSELLQGEAPVERFEQALDQGDVERAIKALTRLAQENHRGEALDDERIETLVVGFAKLLWEWNREEVQQEGVVRHRLDEALRCLRLEVFLPYEEIYDSNRHRIVGREPARPGEPVNQVIGVDYPGFAQRLDGQAERVVEKAAVIISDY